MDYDVALRLEKNEVVNAFTKKLRGFCFFSTSFS